jgi:hypothetical protein
MKRAIISACLLCAANSCAINHAARAILVMTLPVAIPALYYCNETNVQRAVLKKEMEAQGTHSAEEIKDAVSRLNNPLMTFADGVMQGMAPGMNLAKLNNSSTVGPRGVRDMVPEERAGFYSGLLVYPTAATYAISLSLLGVLKKAK